jgi:hypothetical protein
MSAISNKAKCSETTLVVSIAGHSPFACVCMYKKGVFRKCRRSLPQPFTILTYITFTFYFTPAFFLMLQQHTSTIVDLLRFLLTVLDRFLHMDHPP